VGRGGRSIRRIPIPGTRGGIYISFDWGNSWAPVNEGLIGSQIVYSIAVDPNNPDNVYAATPYGIFKLEGNRP
jgi:hypothetical protein